jgi:transcriptional regulator with XRE-family HTH domain
MNNIGERLEEARTRKGISIREAAEATKIRGDYLASFENDSFEIPLPEIYRRGFLKLYANYLNLDAEQIITDYNALQLGNARLNRGGREVYGRVDLAESEEDAGAHEQPDRGDHSRAARSKPRRGGAPIATTPQAEFGANGNEAGGVTAHDRDEERGREKPGIDLGDKAIFLQVGAVVAVGLIGLILIIFMIQNLSTSAPPEPDAQTANATTGEAQNTDNGGGAAANAGGTTAAELPEALILRASGEVFVQVRDVSTDTVLFFGQLSAGDTERIPLEGEAQIGFSASENLTIETPAGAEYSIGGIGRGVIRTSDLR